MTEHEQRNLTYSSSPVVRAREEVERALPRTVKKAAIAGNATKWAISDFAEAAPRNHYIDSGETNPSFP